MNKMNQVVLFMFFVLYGNACSSVDIESVNNIDFIIQNKDKYHDKVIRVEGVLSFKFENMALYKGLYEENNFKPEKAVWLNILEGRNDSSNIEEVTKIILKYKELDGKHVIIKGKFNKNKKGHFSLFSGEVDEITEIIKN